jgi:hypothetical protein
MGPIAFDAARSVEVFRRPLDREILFYAAASTLDVVFTYLLLYGDGPWVFVESNPVANFFLATGGFLGMVVYKALLVALVVINCRVIARHRPETALKVIRFAQVAVGAVLAYSVFLLIRYA